jgi:hypothetical protein
LILPFSFNVEFFSSSAAEASTEDNTLTAPNAAVPATIFLMAARLEDEVDIL